MKKDSAKIGWVKAGYENPKLKAILFKDGDVLTVSEPEQEEGGPVLPVGDGGDAN